MSDTGLPDRHSGWDAVRAELESRLRGLADGAALVLGEPQQQGPPRGLLRRSKPLPGRYVQALRTGDQLSGECVGARLFGGDADISREDHERLRADGWLAPGDLVDTEPGYPNYRCDLPLAEAGVLADRQVAALAVLGLEPADVVFELPGRG